MPFSCMRNHIQTRGLSLYTHSCRLDDGTIPLLFSPLLANKVLIFFSLDPFLFCFFFLFLFYLSIFFCCFVCIQFISDMNRSRKYCPPSLALRVAHLPTSPDESMLMRLEVPPSLRSPACLTCPSLSHFHMRRWPQFRLAAIIIIIIISIEVLMHRSEYL